MEETIAQMFGRVEGVAMESSLAEQAAVDTLEVAQRLEFAISQAALFSENETIADVATGHIPLMLSAYYTGVLSLAIQSQERRATALETAEAHFDKFLSLLDTYRLLTQEQKSVWRTGRYSNPSRDEAISWLRQKKNLETAMETLKRREDEEALRELHLMRIQHAVQETFSHLKFCKLELQMLKMRREGPPEPPKQVPQGLRYVKIDVLSIQETNVHTMPPLISSFEQLANTKQRIQAKVFTPCFHMPAMTVEEFGEMELARCKECEAARAANPPPPKVDSDDSDEEKLEAKRKKDSAWDDWKDEHEKGGGNKLR